MSADPMIFTGGTLGLMGLGAVLSIWGVSMNDPEQYSAGVLLTILAPYLVTWAPDVNHGDHGLRPSDQIKDLLYHEYAHSAHWNALNDNNYWIENAFYIAENMGYGDGTANGAGRCGAIEMWGYHMGPFYTDRRYGLHHSNTSSSNPQTILETRHIFELERFMPDPTSIDPDKWIPKGVFLDCIDDNALNPTGVTDGVLSDNVTGYSLSNCLQAISDSPEAVQAVRDILKNNFLPIGVNPASVDALFLEYGF
jgi:hypothetical protein